MAEYKGLKLGNSERYLTSGSVDVTAELTKVRGVATCFVELDPGAAPLGSFINRRRASSP